MAVFHIIFYKALFKSRTSVKSEGDNFMQNIGKISNYTVKWDAWSGAVYVDIQRAKTACGNNEIAYSKDRALEVARDYIRRAYIA